MYNSLLNTVNPFHQDAAAANKRLASLPFSWFVEVLFSISNLFLKLKFRVPKSATNANRPPVIGNYVLYRYCQFNPYLATTKHNKKEYKKWRRVATVELNGYFKVSDFHSVLQTFFPSTFHILKRYQFIKEISSSV